MSPRTMSESSSVPESVAAHPGRFLPSATDSGLRADAFHRRLPRKPTVAYRATGLIAILVGAAVVSAGQDDKRSPKSPKATAEERAVAFLTREVPRWTRENHCVSCHNNGDAARALYEASRAGFAVPPEVLADTTAWLARPDGWNRDGGKGGVSDKRLRGSRSPLPSRRRRAPDGCAIARHFGMLQPSSPVIRPTTAHGGWRASRHPDRPRRTASRWRLSWHARRLDAADPSRFRAAIRRADGWLLCCEPVTVADASVALMVIAAGAPTDAEARRRQALSFLARRPVGGRRMGALRNLAARAVRHGHRAPRPRPVG